MMFSWRSDSALVMKRLTPVMFQEPSSLGVAFARPAPTSEPASGSVSTMVHPHWRSTMSWATRLSRSTPLALFHTTPAKGAPAAYIHTGALAPSTISPSAQIRELGAGVPPRSSLIWRRQNSASIHAW